ncbi:MAG TPA: hypothetical protein K8W16_09970, partial [Mailhella massiliensis]|nr:hypothetical protein [Mailhella massiliensis]
MRLVLFLAMLLAFSCPARALTVCSPSGFTEAGMPVDALLTGAGADARDVHARQESVKGDGDVLEAFNALFLARGWGDGLPLIPPTPERVEKMVAGCGLPGDLPIAVLAPMGGVATVENIAVNAVMAGCEPRHMPLLTAAVEAVSQPEFDLRGMATTTNPDAVLMIVSGPMVEKLGLNAGCGTFGRGSRGNAAVSRALHLIIQNVGGSRPGITDMSNLGQPGDFVMFLAENAGASPWTSYHTEMGFPEESNVVTVAAVEGYAGIMGIGYDGREYLELIAAWLRGHDRPYRSAVILVVAQDTAKMLEREGWTRENMRAYLREHARIPLREWRRLYHAEKERRRGVPREAFSLRDGNALVPKPFWDAMPIIVSGGAGEKSMLMPCWAAGRMVSREVRLPQER